MLTWAKLRTRPRVANHPREGPGVPPGEDPPSSGGAIRMRQNSANVAAIVASHAAHRARGRSHLLVDCAIAAVVFAASLVLLVVGAHMDDPGGDDALSIALVAATALPLVARRRAPLAVFVVTALASTALRAVTEPAGPPIGATLALYWMVAGADESRPRTRLMAAVVIGMLLAHAAASGLSQDRLPATEALFCVLVWGGAWLAGDRTRLRAQRMAELEERARRAERDAERERRLAAAEERTRIARDLHDSAGHSINVILVHAGLGRLRSNDDPAARDAFATIEEVARETVGEIDQMVRALREDEAGVEPPAGLAALDALVERHRAAGLELDVAVTGAARSLPAAVDRGAYRIVQEALTNAARHGDGHVRLRVTAAGTFLELTVINSVRADRPVRAGDGHGITGMRERASMLGGTLDASARDGHF